MGVIFSRSAASAALPPPLPTLTIRNLTITPLELKEAKSIDWHTHLHRPREFEKVASHAGGERRSHELGASGITSGDGGHGEDGPPPTASHIIKDITIQPFSECLTAICPPGTAHNKRLRLTFEDLTTGHQYSAAIPGTSHRTIVLLPHQPPSDSEPNKEFTAIYFPSHAYLALFSSANLSSWMSTLPSTLPLSSLSIPGTHNSPTHHVALPSVRCQAVPVLEQLTNGVRFLDVRVSCPSYNPSSSCPPPDSSRPELALVHAAFPVSLTGAKHLSALLSAVYTFLSRHPSETVLLSLKREGTGRGTDAHLSQILHSHYITPHASRWYTSPGIPSLAQCRGKIVLVRRFCLDPSIPAAQGGIDGSAWPDNVADGTCGSGTIRIQDYYGVGNATEIKRKVRFAQEGLDRAAQGLGVCPRGEGVPQTPLFINFLSASNFFNASCWPDRIALKINPSMIEYLCMEHGKRGKGPEQSDPRDAVTGIVVIDWVGHHGDWDLVRCIVGWNARLQLQQ
ncbi:hypothetical protein VTI74DRAFT_5468 [Chaetomium olivicolor]